MTTFLEKRLSHSCTEANLLTCGRRLLGAILGCPVATQTGGILTWAFFGNH